MIVCPNCKEDIDDGSRFCDQCGQALLYCNRCGRVGIGRRCTQCGGLMISAHEYQENQAAQTAYSSSTGFVSMQTSQSARPMVDVMPMGVGTGMPMLTLYNSSLNIRFQGINGAVIGRRQGPYQLFFKNNPYVSGVHAQLQYNAGTGWSITDKHSSNGTKLNQHILQPDVEMTLKNGDILTIANVSLQVSVV